MAIASAPPDAVYLHGNLLTLDAACPSAQALAVLGDRILAVGADADIAALAANGTVRHDLGGRFVVPGFNDAHTHLLLAGRNKLELELSGLRSLGELQQRVGAHAAILPPGEWILGSRWDSTLWPGQQLPTRRDLDPFTGGHPALLHRLDLHAAVVNSAALERAGIGFSTPAPAGGALDAARGLLFETAVRMLTAVVPPISTEQRRRALRLAMHEAVAHGVTSVQDNSGWEAFLDFEALQQAGELPIRVSEWLNFNDPLTTLEEQRAHHAPDRWLRTGMLKAFMDGSLGSRTASLLAPYSDDPGNCGLPRYEQAELNRLSIERARAGFQLGFHAIGDAAARMALNAFAAAQAAAGTFDSRHRIEHLQILAPEDLVRMGQLGVVASVQPSHLLDDCRWALERLGAARAREAYPWRSFFDHGVTLAFGTDVPVASINPLLTICAALTRAGGYPPDSECLSLEQALYASMMGSATAEFAEDRKGSLTLGKLADFVVLSEDLRTIPASGIPEVKILRTVVGGQTQFEL